MSELEYRRVDSIHGALMFLRKVDGVALGDRVVIRGKDGERRNGQPGDPQAGDRVEGRDPDHGLLVGLFHDAGREPRVFLRAYKDILFSPGGSTVFVLMFFFLPIAWYTHLLLLLL